MLRILINVLMLAIMGQVSVSSPKGCDELANPENGIVVVTGTKATYRCVSGYNLFGNVNRVCSEQHGWNGTEPVCYKDCPEIQNNPQTILQINGHHYQSVATYTCLVGHCRETGDFNRTCLANGTWSGSELVCGKDCTQTTNGVTSGQYNHTDCIQTTDGLTSGQDNHKETFDYKIILIVVGSLIAVGVVVGVWYTLWRNGTCTTYILEQWDKYCHGGSHYYATPHSKQTENAQEDSKENGNIVATSVYPTYDNTKARGYDADGGYEEIGRVARDQVEENWNMPATWDNATYKHTVTRGCDADGDYEEPRPATREQVKEHIGIRILMGVLRQPMERRTILKTRTVNKHTSTRLSEMI